MNNKPIGYKINVTSKLFNQVVNEIAQENGMNKTHFNIISYLARKRDKEVTQKELCEYLHFKAPTISLTLQSMETDGYINRTKSVNDSRNTIVKLTEKGFKKDNEVRLIFEETDLLIEKSLTKEEFKEFNSCLDKVSTALENKVKKC